MIVTLEKQLSIIGERTFDNYLMLKQARRQRRTEYTDIYGVPFRSETPEKAKVSEFHLFISPDIEYWERFQFKLMVTGASGSFDQNGFSFKIIELDDDGEEVSSSGDLSSYLEAQHDVWVDGNGFFPTEEISDEGADAEDFFDILDASTIMWSEKKTKSVNTVLNGGTKKVRITAPVECDVTFIPYIKYSTVNR